MVTGCSVASSGLEKGYESQSPRVPVRLSGMLSASWKGTICDQGMIGAGKDRGMGLNRQAKPEQVFHEFLIRDLDNVS
jgi:hypothetical protein